MRVMVTLTITGEKETRLVGNAPAFGNGIDYKKGVDSRLKGIGFWLLDWSYAGNSGPAHKGKVFVPWGSALYIQEVEEGEN